ncbi:MAG: hypothetical protein ACOXZR_04185 [Bacilli bacterium]|jgi:hypothetical protein
MLSILYGVNIPAINKHIKNIYLDEELTEKATIRNFRIVQKEGSQEVFSESISKILENWYNIIIK